MVREHIGSLVVLIVLLLIGGEVWSCASAAGKTCDPEAKWSSFHSRTLCSSDFLDAGSE